MPFQSSQCEMSCWTSVIGKVLLSGIFSLDCIRAFFFFFFCSAAAVLHRTPFPCLPPGCIPHISAARHLPANPPLTSPDGLSTRSSVLSLTLTAFTHPLKRCPSSVAMVCLIGASDSHCKCFVGKGSARLHLHTFSSEHSGWYTVGSKGMR